MQWLPFTRPLFDAIVHVEEELRWPNGTDLLISERHDIREEWSYFAALREARLFGRGAAHTTRRKAMKVSRKLGRAVEKVAAKLSRMKAADEPDVATPLVSGVEGGAEGGAGGRAAPAGATSPPKQASVDMRALLNVRREVVNPLQDGVVLEL